MDDARSAEPSAPPALFPDVADPADRTESASIDRPPKAKAAPRLRLAARFQNQVFCETLDKRIDDDHPVRAVWTFVESVDLAPLHDRIKAVKGNVGRNANDPRILLALWLFASIEGVGSARELDRLCREHRAFEWICGGVSVNYHTLADFRVSHGEFLDKLFARSIASLSREGLVDVNLVAQDGMRIRASAGSDTFRREGTLKEHLERAETHLANLKAELDLNGNQLDARRKAAQKRAATEKVARIGKAIEHAREIAENREKRKSGDGESARASTTDPEARRMKMPDGGTRPAYNAQFATAVESGLVVGVEVTNAGNDSHELEPMLADIRDNIGETPKTMLLDGGYGTRENVDLADKEGTVLYAPLKAEERQLEEGKDPYAPKRGDSPAMADFRARMGQAESKDLYKLRGQSAEWTNANARRHDLYMLRVRGLAKVKAVLLIFALAHNLQRAAALRAEQQNRG
jgi:transposase